MTEPWQITPEVELEVVSMLAHGSRTFQQAARAAHLPELLVMEIGKAHGYPHLGKLAKEAERLRRELGGKPPSGPVVAGSVSQQTPSRTVVPPANATSQNASQPGGKPEVSTPAALLLDLRKRAQQWPKLVRRVEDIGERLDQATKAVEKAEAEERERQAERQRRAELAREVAEARARLAEVRARLAELGAKAGPAGAAAPKGEPAAIRQWAASHGYVVANFGKIPASVREAWEKAQV